MLLFTLFLAYVDVDAQQNVRNLVSSTIKESELTQ